MTRRVLRIGRWVVDFIFAPRGYDIDGILACLYDCGASRHIMYKAEDLMMGCEMEFASEGPDGLMYECGFNQGFTFSNSARERAVVVIGPTTSGAEFQDTLVHEIHHLAVAIGNHLGFDLMGEGPAYLSGDTMRELADIVCHLGCDHCRK